MTTQIAVDHIVAGVIEDVASREAQVSFKEVKAYSRSQAVPPPRDGVAALLRTGCSLVAELKRAIPFGGEIARLDTPESMAALGQEFEDAGVHVLACQTDFRRHHGSLEDMRTVREATRLPMMCRDIIVDPYQVHEARCFGADIVPLQVELLEQARLEALLDRIESLGMTAMLEVRTCAEADRALAAGAQVIGVNAWSLASDAIDRDAFAAIAPGLPEKVVKVAVGGVNNPRNLLAYASRGADAVIVGESLMASPDPVGTARTLVTVGQHPACASRRQ